VHFGRHTGSHIPEDCISDIYLRDNLKCSITLALEYLRELDNTMEYPDIFLFPSSRARSTIQGKIDYMFRLE
jgi:hypothetical protein